MAIIGMVSTKGGVGKTTIAINVAADLARRSKSVLVVDADPSGSASAIAGSGSISGVEVLHHAIDGTDAETVGAWARSVRSASADYVIVDAEGARGPSFAATVAVSDIVLVPAGASILDLRGAAETIGIIRRHRAGAGRGRPQIIVVPSRIDRRTAAGREIAGALAQIGEPVSDPISSRSAVVDSLASGEAVAPESPSGAEFAFLVDRILGYLGTVI